MLKRSPASAHEQLAPVLRSASASCATPASSLLASVCLPSQPALRERMALLAPRGSPASLPWASRRRFWRMPRSARRVFCRRAVARASHCAVHCVSVTRTAQRRRARQRLREARAARRRRLFATLGLPPSLPLRHRRHHVLRPLQGRLRQRRRRAKHRRLAGAVSESPSSRSIAFFFPSSSLSSQPLLW